MIGEIKNIVDHGARSPRTEVPGGHCIGKVAPGPEEFLEARQSGIGGWERRGGPEGPATKSSPGTQVVCLGDP